MINTGQRIDVALCRQPSSEAAANISSSNASALSDIRGSNSSAWIRAVMVQNAFMMPSSSPGVLGVLKYGRQPSSATGKSSSSYEVI